MLIWHHLTLILFDTFCFLACSGISKIVVNIQKRKNTILNKSLNLVFYIPRSVSNLIKGKKSFQQQGRIQE